MVTTSKTLVREYQEVDVTPDIAESLLELNTNNRKIDFKYVDELARQMATGRWEFNGDPIRISVSGELQDGQQRLHAVIRAGATIKFLVIFNLPDKAMSTIDVGRNRSVLDILKVRGTEIEADAVTVKATANILIELDAEIPYVAHDKVFQADYIEQHLDEITPWIRFSSVVASEAPKVSVKAWGNASRRTISKNVLGALLIHMTREGADPDTLKGFFHGVANGIGMTPEALQALTPQRLSILQTLNRRLLNGTPLGRVPGVNSRSSLTGEMAVYIVAYNRYVNNQAVKVVKGFKETYRNWQDLPKPNTSAVINPHVEIPSDAHEIADSLQAAGQQ